MEQVKRKLSQVRKRLLRLLYRFYGSVYVQIYKFVHCNIIAIKIYVEKYIYKPILQI